LLASWIDSFEFSLLMNPSLGLAESGSAISALIPQTIVVSPILINAEPSAVETEPDMIRLGVFDERRTAYQRLR
jgi:hypothetical protein